MIFVSDGISDNNVISGNYVGTDYTGMVDVGNGEIGVSTFPGANGTIIGGTTSGSRNVISGNDSNSIYMSGNVTAQGNYIGLNSEGNGTIPNAGGSSGASVTMINSNNIFGGTTSGARNYIAGEPAAGISILGLVPFGGSAATENIVQGNCIGTNSSCQYESGYGNGQSGIQLAMVAQNNLIGGTETGAGNIIAGNGGGIGNLGVSTFYPTNNSFLGNSIYNNSGGTLVYIGIDNLQTNDFATYINQGVTANDADDIDYGGTNTGPNHYLNFPELTSVSSTNGTATITYNLDINDTETGATGYRVEFFANDTQDASGHGQGQTYLGSDTVSGDVTARQATITLPAGVEGTKYISAVTTMTDDSTDGFGHSSEFAADVEGTLMPYVSPAQVAVTGLGIYALILIAAGLIVSGTFSVKKLQLKRSKITPQPKLK